MKHWLQIMNRGEVIELESRDMSKIDASLLKDATYLIVSSGYTFNKYEGINKKVIYIGQVYNKEQFLNLNSKKDDIIHLQNIIKNRTNIGGVYKSRVGRKWYYFYDKDYVILHLGKLKDLGVI